MDGHGQDCGRVPLAARGLLSIQGPGPTTANFSIRLLKSAAFCDFCDEQCGYHWYNLTTIGH